MKKNLFILVGIPCSGKSTKVKSWVDEVFTISVSRDEIRELFFDNYVYSTENENKVTTIYNATLNGYINSPSVRNIILDNTHCKEKYINEIIHDYSKICNVYIINFPISLLKAHIRNVFRYLLTGKWIPISVMNAMHKNYKKLNWEKYGTLVYKRSTLPS